MNTKVKITLAVLSLLILTVVYMVYPSSAGVRQLDTVTVSTFSQEFTNVHLVSSDETHILIDAGLPSHKENIESFLLENGVKPSDLSAVIVTHAHHDHAGTAAYFQQNHGVKVIAGAGDLDAYHQGTNGTLCPTSLMAKARDSMDQAGTFPTFTPDVLIDQATDLEQLTGIKGNVYNVPGHTNGSLVIVFDDSAFLGDLLRGGLLSKHAAAMHFYQCDFNAIQAGMKKVLEELAPDVKIFFPSHLGPVTRISMEKMLTSFEN